MSKPSVSVLMTIYNRENFLAAAIESVLASRYQDWELILVDDQSQDDSVNIARKYVSEDDRIRLYINETNLGQFANRDHAAGYACGRYLKYLDSDDMIYPESLHTMVGLMEKNPSAAIGLEVNEDYLNGKEYRLIPGTEALRMTFLEKAFMHCGPTGTIFRKDAFTKMNGFGKDTYVGSDTIFYLRTALEYDILAFKKGFVFYREHGQQELSLKRKEYYIRNLSEYSQIISDPESPFSPEEKRLALVKLRNLYIGQTLNFLRRANFRYVYYTFFRSGFYRRLFFNR